MAIVVVKIGTSSLADTSGRLRDDVVSALVADLVGVRATGHQPVLVTSGAIACGLERLGIAERPTAVPDLQAASAVGQGILFERYLRTFATHGVAAAQVLLTRADLDRRQTYVNARNTLARLLELGAVPIINENDTTATDDITFGDNDVLAALVAVQMEARWLVLLTDREGLYGPGPDGPQLISRVPEGVAPEDVELAALAGTNQGRGGINSKIASASMAVAEGIATVIASGAARDVVSRAVRGELVGTHFPPGSGSRSAFKVWLRYARMPSGAITIDDGAARALVERGTSLLPVGVTACSGGFQVGDVVEVVTDAGTVVGKGVAAMSELQVTAVAGMSSAAAREAQPGFPGEVIHRDQFVLIG